MIGFLGTQSSYRDHLWPVFEALEPFERACWAQSQAGGLPPATLWVSASQRDTAALRKYGRPRVHLEHGVGLQWYQAHQLRPMLDCAAIAAPNEYVASRYRALGKRLRVEVVGTPKMDALRDAVIKNPDSGTVAVAFHWTGVLRQRPDSFELWRPMIEELASEREVLGHAHPKIWPLARHFYEALGIEAVEDFAEVVARASLYLCDHSSTLYEWAALDRELILLRRPGHREIIPQRSGLRWEDYSGIGPELKLGGSLLAALEAAADPQYRLARQEATAALYPHIGSATQRTVALLREIEEGKA